MTAFILKLLFFSPMAFAQSSSLEPQKNISPKQNFHQGLSAFHQKNYKLADQHFKKILKTSPQHTSALYNLGLSAFEQNKIGLALGLWKKTLYIDPQLTHVKKSIEFAQRKLATPEKKSSLWESYRHFVLNFLSLNQWLFLCVVLLSTNGALLLKQLKKRENPPLDPMQETPSLFSSFNIFLCTLFAFSLIVTLTKSIDIFTPRGTITEKTTLLYISPDPNSVDISESIEGEEVIIARHNTNWTQVKTLSGKVGWIKSSHVVHSYGESSW